MAVHFRAQARRNARAISFLSSVSLLALGATELQAAQAAAAAAASPVEEVLITGSLIRGAPAVGVPVTALGDQDFKETGALTVADLLKNVPNVAVTPATTIMNGGNLIGKGQAVAIHGIATGSGTETLLMISGMRYPIQSAFTCYIDPSIIPQLAVDHIDVLADGASATYGSDAVAGVINILLKRGFEGAVTQFRYAQSTDIGGPNYQATILYGTKWDSGDLTLTYEWYHEKNVRGVVRPYYTHNFEPFGFDDKTPIGNAMPGVVSTGALATFPALAAVGFSANNGTRACSNCFSIPTGTGWNYGDTPEHTNPTAPGATPTVTWAQLLGNPGVQHLRNAVADADVTPAQDRNAAVVTFDQDLLDDVFGVVRNLEVFAEGFYSNRRSVTWYNPGQSPAAQQPLRAVTVPTTNPYYPAGAPANLRVSYNLGVEHNSRVSSGELASRYAFGFNADLPFDWRGRLYYSMSHEQNYVYVSGMVNLNMVSAALGNTVASQAANGTIPGQAAFTKPANVPYLNLFCDATVYTCNARATLDYIGAYRNYDQHWNLGETGVNLDGPIFDLPGGPLRAALGANYVSNHFYYVEHSNFSTHNTALLINLPDPEKTTVWAVYGQINVPLVGEMNRLPLVEAFNIEAAYRHDHYYDFGGVNTPKIAATWTVGYGLSLRGAWGKAFRAPNFSEKSYNSGVMIQAVNQGAGASTNTVSLNCPAVPGLSTGGTANAGSLNAFLNPTCSTAAALVNPSGISVSGAAGGAAGIRSGEVLGPQTAHNWAVGFNFAPTDLLAGLNIDFTWYHLKIDDLIAANTGGVNVNDPLAKVCTTPTPNCLYIVRANPNLPITDPANAEFLALVNAEVLNPRSAVLPSAIPNIQFINDTAVTNIGWRKIEGLDFDSRYDIDFGNWGAWNVGLNANYRLKDESQTIPGTAVTNVFAGNSGGRLRWRGRVGWTANGGFAEGFNATLFANFVPHGPVLTAGANVPPDCFWKAGFSAGSCYPGSPYWGPFTVFPSYQPGLYTFDLAVGYQTGITPANPYLQNINFQLAINNLLNKAPPFAYNVSGGRGVAAFDRVIGPAQRYITFAITKAW